MQLNVPPWCYCLAFCETLYKYHVTECPPVFAHFKWTWMVHFPTLPSGISNVLEGPVPPIPVNMLLWRFAVADFGWCPWLKHLRLCCWITTLVILFSVRCVFEIWCSWFWVVSVLQAEAQLSLQHRHYSNPTALNLQLKHSSACNTDTTQTQPHQISNTQQTENNTTDVVIQQHSRKLLMMDILMLETCWVHKKWK